MSHLIYSFAPIEPKTAKILILGSMPGRLSLEYQQYYAHPRNAFWWIIGEIFTTDLLSLSYDDRTVFLKQQGIALWDSLAACERQGSLDANIKAKTIVVNDIEGLLTRQQTIKIILFNGQKAAQVFTRYIRGRIERPYVYLTLPSTSPAHARLTQEMKLLHWRQAIETAVLKKS